MKGKREKNVSIFSTINVIFLYTYCNGALRQMHRAEILNRPLSYYWRGDPFECVRHSYTVYIITVIQNIRQSRSSIGLVWYKVINYNTGLSEH